MSSKLISSSFHSTPLNDCFKVGAFERRLGKSMRAGVTCVTCDTDTIKSVGNDMNAKVKCK